MNDAGFLVSTISVTFRLHLSIQTICRQTNRKHRHQK
jgi:hypothetical protein